MIFIFIININIINNKFYYVYKMDPIKDNTTILPDDLIETIMLNSRYPEIIEISNINKNYKKIGDNDMLWKKLIERDFPFMFEYKYKCKLKNKNKYNTYKKIYEIVYYIISRGIYDILATYEKEKKMKNRYQQSIFNELFDLMITMIPNQFINYKELMKNVADILKVTKYNETGLKFLLNTRILDYVDKFDCENIQYINLDKIYY
jgi:hypothetical protein